MYNVIFHQITKHIEIACFLGTWRQITQQQQLTFSHFIFFWLLLNYMSFGYLLKLFLDFIYFRDIDESNMFLTINSLQFETFIYRATIYYINFLFNQGQFNSLFIFYFLYHYYYYQSYQTIIFYQMKKEKPRPKEVYLQRIKCPCMAQKHQLINNCLGCGKIVCAQEGEGNCLYCGKLVTRPDGLFIDDSDKLFPSLSKQQQKNIALERSKAIKHKNQLVERDKSSTQNQNIFDQQVDYYEISENKWLDEGDRQRAIDRILQKEKFVEEQTFKTKIVFDPLTGLFVRQQFDFNQQDFRKQGRQFLQKQQAQQKLAKQSLAKEKHNWDDRILRSQKMKDLYGQLLLKQTSKVSGKFQAKKDAITQIILEKE